MILIQLNWISIDFIFLIFCKLLLSGVVQIQSQSTTTLGHNIDRIEANIDLIGLIFETTRKIKNAIFGRIKPIVPGFVRIGFTEKKTFEWLSLLNFLDSHYDKQPRALDHRPS